MIHHTVPRSTNTRPRVVAALFVLLHGQYKNWTSFLLLGCLEVILGMARITSGGLLAPVLLQ
ncbi:CPBP family glutamic-type intramembrane protease [Pseudomonas paracarnis]|uniref:CPBP family glutamic-type intramembrane protease n=1 Tax=Pseudomonas paracarnis TaxID=2750625 RepID=UPI0035B0E0A9